MFSNADTAEEICREIGRRISLNRRSIGLSQEELAARSGVAKRSVERLNIVRSFMMICCKVG